MSETPRFPASCEVRTVRELPQTFGSFKVRAVGGGPLAGAKLLRSGDLHEATPAELHWLIRGLGVRAIYDVRNEFELASRPQPYPLGTKTVALVPSTEHRAKNAQGRLVAGVIGRYGRPEERMVANYRRYAGEYPLIGAALRGIADEGAVALVHCLNGKDRTGVLCACAQLAAGATWEDVMADYLVANEVNADSIAREAQELGRGMDEAERAILMSFLEARPAYLEAFFDEARCAYGTLERYFERGLHLTPRHRATLERMLCRA